jgi:hypothetical protein
VVAELTAELDKKMEQYRDVPVGVNSYLKSIGLEGTPLPPTDTEPKLLANVAAASTEQLNRLYDDFARFYDYVSRKLSDAESNLTAAKKIMKLLKAVLHFKYRDAPGLAKTDRGPAVYLDWDYIKVDTHLGHFGAIVDALTLRKASLGHGRDRVFREISRRTQSENKFSAPRKSLLQEKPWK